ncbi:MAG: DUF1580 domain-containing protein [Phycisphaerae bacterium]|nr:DUF1580 domain-containing protein [Phycisphaerae bacterium]
MIDVNLETMIPLSKACRVVNPGRPVHTATIWRWIKKGVAGARLEAIRIGGVHYTSHEAIARFLKSLNADKPSAVPEPPDRQAEKAMEQLAALGC